LSEEYQQSWFTELRRVLRPGGLLLLTFYSEHVWRQLGPAADVEQSGFVFRTSAKLRGVVPEWYQTSLQTASHITTTLSAQMSIVNVHERGFGNQDAIIARRE
jgi:hypothetical protein